MKLMSVLKNKRVDSKVESNDSPEIPDRGETSGIPDLPSGVLWEKFHWDNTAVKKEKKRDFWGCTCSLRRFELVIPRPRR